VQEVIPVAKSKPYSSVPVKGVDATALARAHAGQACVLGVDIGKFELMAVLRWPDGSFERPWRIANPSELGTMIAKLNELRPSIPSLLVALESSGTYGDALRQALSDAAVPVQRVSAKAVKDQAETFDGVPSQHDGKDAAIIARTCAPAAKGVLGRCGPPARRTRRSATGCAGWMPPSGSSRSGAGRSRRCWRGTGRKQRG
jgi:hypothetical protein